MREPSAAIRRVMMTERAGGRSRPAPASSGCTPGDPDFATPAYIAEALADAVEPATPATRRSRAIQSCAP